MTEIVTRIRADTSEIDMALENLKNLSSEFGNQLANGMKNAASQGKELDDILQKITLNIAGAALEQGLKPLGGLFRGLLGGDSSGSAGFLSNLIPFADGGVISSPSYFPAGGSRWGVAGEAGAEAILPLQRSSDGSLGVALSGRGSPGMNIVFNVATPDASSFRKSESQITGMLAQAVRRGTRTLNNV